MEGQCARLPWPGTCGTCRKQGHLRQECPENKTEATSYYQEQTSKLEQVSTSDYYDDDQDSDGCEAVAFAFVKEAVTPEANTLNKHLPRPISDSGASHGITCDTNIVSNVLQTSHLNFFSPQGLQSASAGQANLSHGIYA